MLVYQLARELGVESNDILVRCQRDGLSVKHPSESLSPDHEATIRSWYPVPAVLPPAVAAPAVPVPPPEVPTLDPPIGATRAPLWVMIVGAVLLGLTLLFIMALIVLGIDVREGNYFLIIAVLSLGTGGGSGFLLADAAIRGRILLPFARKHPFQFSASGGVAVILLVLIVCALIFPSPFDDPVITIPADPLHKGADRINYDNTELNHFPRQDVAWVDTAQVESKKEFGVRLAPGAKEGWFRATHIKDGDGGWALYVTYFVSRKNKNQNNPPPTYEPAEP